MGAGRTKAVQQPDGTWHITGVKRFITSAEADFYDNVVHFVLARPEGSVAGTKGLSLFLVPKFHVDLETGELGERNGVYVTNVEHKMGLKVSTTCEVTFGDKQPAVGTLLGDSHNGIAQMFTVIENARMFRLARQSLVYGVGPVVSKFIGVFLLPLYTSYLTTKDYGVVALLMSAEVVAVIIFRAGIQNAFFRFYYLSSDPLERRTVVRTSFWYTMVASTFGLICGQLLAPQIAGMGHNYATRQTERQRNGEKSLGVHLEP